MSYAPLEEQILAYSRAWESMIDLPGIYVNHVFVASNLDDDGTAAITESRWQYRHAEIKWSLPACAGMSNDALEETIVHELCHVLLAPLDDRMKTGSDDLCEFATENVARALLAVWKKTRGDL